MSSSRRLHPVPRAALKAAAVAVVVLVGPAAAGAFASFARSVVGGPMTVSTATLTAPSGLSASNPCTSATSISSSLSWTASSAPATSGYSILRSTSSTGPFSSVGTVSGISTTTYTDNVSHPSVADSLYVALKSPNGMDVVSMATNAVTASSGGPNLNKPTNIAVTPDGSTAYLVNSGATTVTPVSLASDTAGTAIDVPKPPTGIAIAPNGATAWVADGTGNAVVPITVATNTAGAPISLGSNNATAIAITPDGTTAWVAGQNKVTAIDLSSLTAGTTYSPGAASFQAIAISPNGTAAYLVDSGGKKLWAFDLSSGSFSASTSLGITVQALAITPDGTTAWIVGGSTMVPVTLSTMTAGAPVNTGGAKFQGVAISPNGCYVYGADASGANQLVVLNAVTGASVTTIATDTAPSDVATAFPPVAYHYEVEGTRNLWTSPASGQASLSFGQPSQAS